MSNSNLVNWGWSYNRKNGVEVAIYPKHNEKELNDK